MTTLPASFPASLRFLRKRARLTQDELGRAVGYSREQIARLENGSRLPDLAVVAALFVPVLLRNQEKSLVEQFLTLAGQTRAESQVTITHTRQTRVQLVSETLIPPASAGHRPPSPLLPLIGRAAEVADLLALLPTTRLLTLLGAPGIGKSRLALEVAHHSLPYFTDGVVFVPLADVASPADVPYALLRAFSLTPAPQQTVETALADYLAPRHLLLVLDNCEHILDSTPHFTAWLARAPRLKLLCTSRVPLDLYGEQEYPLAPLPAPNLAEPPDLARWAEFPALQLLLARVRAALPTFALTPENLLSLATLCVALDGLPLALELAAVRLRDLPPDELVQQLLTLRGNGQLSSTWFQQTKRNIAERHRTLQAAIEWSVRRLTPEQQTAFYRLGAFTGGCTEDAARAVAAPDPGLLTDLARASLIHLREGRVTLLETLRTYAYEHLLAHAPDAQAEHARYYAAFAAEVFPGVLGDEQAAWMQRALTDHENCLVALRWALRHARGDIAVPLAGGLWWFWYRQGWFTLGREMLTAALLLPSSDLMWRARALNGLASFCLAQEDYAANLAYHQEGLALRRQLGDAEGIGTVLHNMGLTALTMGDFAQASAWLEESIAADRMSDPMMAWTHLGLIAQEMQDLPRARHWLEQAYQRAQPLSEGWAQAFVMNFLADVLRDMGELAPAKALAQDSLRIFDALNDSYYRPDPQFLLAQLAGDEGDTATALEQATLALAQYEARQDAVVTAWVQLFLAELAWKRGESEEAARWLRCASTLRQTVKRPLSPREQARYVWLQRIVGS